ncbi:MAG TPA: GtrA family protein [Herpetosiphonaceae bacterium]|nr:GtrA family protein [Herpetosiphonaceae bacterium]
MISMLSPRQFPSLRWQNWRGQLRQALVYGMVGGSSTVIDIAAFNLLVALLAPSAPLALTAASAASTLASSLNSYAGHRRWTFKGGAERGGRLGAFLLLNLLTMGLSLGLVLAWSAALPHLLTLTSLEVANASKLLAIAGSGLAGFLGNKFWIFKG